MPEKDVFTLEEAAKELGLSLPAVRYLAEVYGRELGLLRTWEGQPAFGRHHLAELAALLDIAPPRDAGETDTPSAPSAAPNPFPLLERLAGELERIAAGQQTVLAELQGIEQLLSELLKYVEKLSRRQEQSGRAEAGSSAGVRPWRPEPLQ